MQTRNKTSFRLPEVTVLALSGIAVLARLIIRRLRLNEKGFGGVELRRITHFLQRIFCSESK